MKMNKNINKNIKIKANNKSMAIENQVHLNNTINSEINQIKSNKSMAIENQVHPKNENRISNNNINNVGNNINNVENNMNNEENNNISLDTTNNDIMQDHMENSKPSDTLSDTSVDTDTLSDTSVDTDTLNDTSVSDNESVDQNQKSADSFEQNMIPFDLKGTLFDSSDLDGIPDSPVNILMMKRFEKYFKNQAMNIDIDKKMSKRDQKIIEKNPRVKIVFTTALKYLSYLKVNINNPIFNKQKDIKNYRDIPEIIIVYIKNGVKAQYLHKKISQDKVDPINILRFINYFVGIYPDEFHSEGEKAQKLIIDEQKKLKKKKKNTRNPK